MDPPLVGALCGERIASTSTVPVQRWPVSDQTMTFDHNVGGPSRGGTGPIVILWIFRIGAATVVAERGLEDLMMGGGVA